MPCANRRRLEAMRRHGIKRRKRQGAYVCKDCGADITETRIAKNAQYCLPCSYRRRQETFRRHDLKRREKRKEYAQSPERREANNAASRRYMQTEKGRLTRARAASKPERIAYLKSYYRNNRERILAKSQRKRRNAAFETKTDRRLRFRTGAVRRKNPDIKHDIFWQPFQVPDYLKSKNRD